MADTERQSLIPPPPPPRVGPLNTIQRIRGEMARLYKEARAGAVKTEDASRLAFILMSLARLIETSDLEDRLNTIEHQVLHERHRGGP
jgi:hypothetical protein